jgi:Na+-translocating ferredoxin:NAD+ oxidoreductase subunit G
MSDHGKKLPVTPDQTIGESHARAHGFGGEGPQGPGGPEGPAVREVPSWQLVATLAFAGALAGILIVGVFNWAEPQILEHRARVMAEAVDEVLAAPDRVVRLFVLPDGLTGEAPPGADTIRAEKVYMGFSEGSPVGYAVVGQKPGFADVIQIIFGYDPATRQVLGMRVLESKETPGLGDKIFKDLRFVRGFEGVLAPIRPVPEGAHSGAPNDAELITGATISARVVVEIINERVARLHDRLETYTATGLWPDALGEGGVQ